MAMKKRLFLFVCLLVGMLSAMAQTPTTQGKEFWVSYMRNGHWGSNSDYDNCRLIISAKEDGVVTVSNERTDYSVDIPVRAGQVVMQTIPSAYAYNTSTEGRAYTGIHVTSTSVISLYIGNESHNSYDASNVLPVSALGTDYLIQTFDSKYANGTGSHANDIRASFMIIATEDGTTVEITPSTTTAGNHSPGQAYPVELIRGQVYHVMTKNNSTSTSPLAGDFSGTRVVANKPIAVFNGNCLTAVPGGGNTSTGYDHVFEQAMPVDYWGKKFVVTSTRAPEEIPQPLENDVVKVTALEDNTVVNSDNGKERVLFNMNAGESRTFNMDLYTEPCAYLEANNRIAVFLYNHSHAARKDEPYGDPSMVWISPVEQTLEEVTFTTFNVQQVENHFVNIVCYTDYCSEMTLDGTNISGQFNPVPGNPDLSYVRYPISHNYHTLQCPGGFIAHVYGIGQAEGYAYSVGSSAKILTKQLYVDEMLSTELPSGFAICQHDELHFRVETNYEMDHVRWNFGDNTPIQEGESVTHPFHASGRFPVEAVIYRKMNDVTLPFDTVSVTIPVNPVKTNYLELISCDQPPGDHYDTLQTYLGCDSIVHTHIVAGGMNTMVITDRGCGEYRFRDSTFTTSGIHEYLVQMEEGCDSLYEFHLTINQIPPHPERTVESCKPTFIWGYWLDASVDTTYTYETPEGCQYDSILHFILKEPEATFDTAVACNSYWWQDGSQWLTDEGENDYTYTTVVANGCDTIRHLHLTLNNTPSMGIMGLTNVAVSTSFWPGQYLYYLADSTGLDTQAVHWTLSDNEEGEWEFRPHGASCTIVTYTMGSKVLRVESEYDNDCNTSDSLMISCYGYAVDEIAMDRLRIYPNPANEELMVEGEGLKRVAVFNLLGQMLKETACLGETRTRVSVHDLPQALYLVQVETVHGNKTQLISVTR